MALETMLKHLPTDFEGAGGAPARIPQAISAAVNASQEGFPPQDLRSFLELCAGEWLALRSHFDLSLVAPAEEMAQATPEGGSVSDPTARPPGLSQADQAAAPADQAQDEAALPDLLALLQQARGELVEEVASDEAWHSSERGELQVAFLAPGSADQPGGLQVLPTGGVSRELHFRADGSFSGALEGAPQGTWRLWPDGSLELTLESPGRELRERIWFTQPNLRLRSSVEQGDDGRPGRARFSSEIRRVRKPAA